MVAVAILKVIFRSNRHFDIWIRSPEILVRNVAFVGVLRCIRIVYYWVASSNEHVKCRLDWLRTRERNYVPVIYTDKNLLQIRTNKFFLQIRSFYRWGPDRRPSTSHHCYETRFGELALSYARLAAWNSLPPEICDDTDYQAFRE